MMYKHCLRRMNVALMLAFAGGAMGQGIDPRVLDAPTTTTEATTATLVDLSIFPYTDYALVLRRHVNDDGLVDYAALKANREPLDRFVAALAAVPREQYENWNGADKLAFWINAYNALMLKTVIDHYPIRSGGLVTDALYPSNSIRQVAGAWDAARVVAGREVSLNKIEHEILRAEFQEPRIHLALTCAAVDGPALRKEPYLGEQLDTQLALQAQRFLNDARRLAIDPVIRRVRISAIFERHGDDFIPTYENQAGTASRATRDEAVLWFASQYNDHLRWPAARNYQLQFREFDWTLNDQAKK